MKFRLSNNPKIVIGKTYFVDFKDGHPILNYDYKGIVKVLSYRGELSYPHHRGRLFYSCELKKRTTRYQRYSLCIDTNAFIREVIEE